METGKQPENEIIQIYRKYGISKNMTKDVKQEGTGLLAKTEVGWNQATKTKLSG